MQRMSSTYFSHQNRFHQNNRLFLSLQYMTFLRPIQRLFGLRIRLIVILLIFTFVIIFTVKSLQSTSSSNVNLLVSNEFDEHLFHFRDHLQYAVMIDAGSSGSRVHIYVWPPHSGDARQLLQIRMLHNDLGKDVYTKITPGLSSCSNNPSSASQYIDPLLKFASQNIPAHKHKETPLFILATAGMRLLPLEAQNAILDDLRRDIPKNYSFLFPKNHVQVISGKEEGIYSWIAVNYLMGRFDHSMDSGPMNTIEGSNGFIKRSQTISMLEMGGASVQIAYEVTSKEQLERIKKMNSEESLKNVISEFNLGCTSHDSDHHYRLFVTTYLGLGANVARATYINGLISETINDKTANTSLATKEIILYDPCLCVDSSENVNITRKWKNNNGSTVFVYIIRGTGDFNACEAKLKQMLDPRLESSRQCVSNSTCPLTLLDNTRVPFDTSELYGFSELWYSMEDMLRMGGQYSYNSYREASAKLCAMSWSVIQDRAKRKLYPSADDERLLHQCFKSAWITSILHQGFKMPKSYTKYKSVSTVNGEQVQWTLGALIFRTRFFPLRAIEHLSMGHSSRGNISSAPYFVNYLLFILCMIAVVACIVIYLRHLHKMVNNYSISKLNENMHDDEEALIGIRIEKEQLIDPIR